MLYQVVIVHRVVLDSDCLHLHSIVRALTSSLLELGLGTLASPMISSLHAFTSVGRQSITLPLNNITMPPSINPFPVLRTVALRPRPAVIRRGNVAAGVVGRRTFADKSKDVPEAEQGAVGPNMQQAEHVSEEAAKMAKIQGGEGPDIEGQGTPVQDVSRRCT